MSTKLESLVEYLREMSEDPKVIDKLILENFNTQELTDYEVNGANYEVLSIDDRERYMKDMAQNLADSDIRDLNNFIKYKSNNERLLSIIEIIDLDDYADLIYHDISNENFEEYYSFEQVNIDGEHYIYRQL